MSLFAQAEPMNRPWILSDKIIEFAVPLYLIALVLQTLVTVLKIRSNQGLRDKLLENGKNEALNKSFDEASRITKLEPLKWVFLTLALALSFFAIDLFSKSNSISELMSLTIVFVFISGSFAGYYYILNRKN